jgi:hypothetical protein
MVLTKYDLIVAQVKFMNEMLYNNPNNKNILNLVYKYIERYKNINVELSFLENKNIVEIIKIN